VKVLLATSAEQSKKLAKSHQEKAVLAEELCLTRELVCDLNDRTVSLHQQASQANIAYQHKYYALRDVDAKIKKSKG
jgi:hypothetical protein